MGRDWGSAPTGLSVPIVTALDSDGQLIESDQRALVRHVIQHGRGADMVFYMGTTGEWDRVPNALRQSVIRICADEVARVNVELSDVRAAPVASWAGVTAPNPEETLANLACALDAGADGAIVAPLAIRGVDDPLRFLREDVGDVLAAQARQLPVFLYDNADIAVDPARPYLSDEEAAAISRLDFVRGIKVSAPIDVVDQHLRVNAGRGADEYGVHVGYGSLVFELFARPESESEARPSGIVCGPANCLPREWAHAWRSCVAGDREAARRAKGVVDLFRELTFTPDGRRTIAVLKRALLLDGVLSSDALAEGTPALGDADRARFDAGYAALRADASDRMAAPWITPRSAGRG
ncbi:MAG: dihydrodipicolinate synthase family protein [Deltaproteobacteria bacterium]|nr:dihydrodipicolinate synthase family protein [Deltaproteobacteria bacterium]